MIALEGGQQTSGAGTGPDAAEVMRRWAMIGCAVDCAQVVVLIAERESGRILDANRSAEICLRQGRAALEAANLGDLVTPATAAAIQDAARPGHSETAGEIWWRGALIDSAGSLMDADFTVGLSHPVVGPLTVIARPCKPVPAFSRIRDLEREVSDYRAAEAVLRENEQRFRQLAEAASEWFWETDADHRLVEVTERFFEISGLSPSAILGRTRAEIVGPEMVAKYPAIWQPYLKALADLQPFRKLEFPIRRADGSRCFISISGQPVFAADGRFVGYRGVGLDITHRVLADAALREAQDRLERRVEERTLQLEAEIVERKRVEANLRKLTVAVEQSPAALFITDHQGVVEYVNPRFIAVTGYREAEVVGRPLPLLRVGLTPRSVVQTLWAGIEAGQEWRGELLNRRKDGGLYWSFVSLAPIRDPDGRLTHILGIKEDLSERKQHEERLLYQANYDALTGLPNRFLAVDRLTQSLANAHRAGRRVVVLMVDLDHFKRVNDTLGHGAGDQLLVEAAQRLLRGVRETDTVARLGGDEFMVFLPDTEPSFRPEAAAERILENLAMPFRIEGQEVFIGASIGLTVYPDDGANPHDLLRNADAAMYQAKEAGRNAYRFFTPEMNRQAVERLALESRLRHALERQEMHVVYQPVVEARTGRLAAAEALVRWRNSDLGLVPPDRFVPLAEDTGLVATIDAWVMAQACQEAVRWQRPDRLPVTVSVNLSPRQFRGLGLIDTVTRILSDTGLPATCLALEITERLLIGNVPDAVTVMRELSTLGVRFYIDDFGIGYSALGYLRKFPVAALKIDKSFVRDVTHDVADAALARSIIAMAHSLGLEAIGEGIETEAQLDFLRAEGCDYIQGYYFSRPIPPSDFLAMVAGTGLFGTGRGSDIDGQRSGPCSSQ